MSHLHDEHARWTILRPSVIVGRGSDIFNPVGIRFGTLLLCPGPRRRILGLIHVDDVAAAILKVMQNDATRGRIFNVSAEAVTQKQYIDEFLRAIGYHKLRVIYMPYWLPRCGAGLLAGLRLLSRRVPTIHERQLASFYQSARIDSNAIRTETGWRPTVNLLRTLVLETQQSGSAVADDRDEAMTKLAISAE